MITPDPAERLLRVLLSAKAETADWWKLALCQETDPDAFFPEKGAATRPAKRICMGCDVRLPCLQYAIDHNEKFGVWGGKSEHERRAIKRQQARQVAA